MTLTQLDDLGICAAEGQPVTLVATDIEGSTELWEWDKASMMEAVNIHDRILRCHLSKHFGYEVSTEGMHSCANASEHGSMLPVDWHNVSCYVCFQCKICMSRHLPFHAVHSSDWLLLAC